jgi:hypothetical protein
LEFSHTTAGDAMRTSLPYSNPLSLIGLGVKDIRTMHRCMQIQIYPMLEKAEKMKPKYYDREILIIIIINNI